MEARRPLGREPQDIFFERWLISLTGRLEMGTDGTDIPDNLPGAEIGRHGVIYNSRTKQSTTRPPTSAVPGATPGRAKMIDPFPCRTVSSPPSAAASRIDAEPHPPSSKMPRRPANTRARIR